MFLKICTKRGGTVVEKASTRIKKHIPPTTMGTAVTIFGVMEMRKKELKIPRQVQAPMPDAQQALHLPGPTPKEL